MEPGAPGVLFDVGYCLMDEAPRLDHALDWLSRALAGTPPSPGVRDLHDAYLAACRRPDPLEPSLLVQMLQSLGVPAETTTALRRVVPWDAVPLAVYPDAVSAVRDLRSAGLRIGVLANQPRSTLEELDHAGITALCEGVWLSAAVGLAKPDPAFFRVALDAWKVDPDRVAYVGDRPDNDVAPARALGLTTVRVRRGPHAAQPERSAAERADIEAADLGEAARRLIAWSRSRASA